MLRLASLLSPLVLIPTLASAQSDGWAPPAHARRSGNAGSAMPGNWSVARQQMILDQTDLPTGFVPFKVLNKIAYRRSAILANINMTYGAKPMLVEVQVGNSPISGGGMTTLWSGNRPNDTTVVLPLSNLNLPSDPPIGVFNEVGPDIMIFPFRTPKIFTGPHLFVEHVNNLPPAATSVYLADALDNSAAGGHNATRGQFGCGATPPTPTTLRPPSRPR